MLLIKNNNISDPGMNLALEEYCLQNLDVVNDYVLFYINQPSIIIGKHQNPFKECNVAYARKRGIQIVRRISGGGAVFHDHGTLLFDSDLDVLQRALTSKLDFIESRGVQSVKSNVTNISEYTDDSIRMNIFLRKLVEKFSECSGELKELKLTGDDWDRIYALSENKYKSWEWTYGKSPGFAVRHSFNYASQKIDAAVYVRHGMIENIEFTLFDCGYSSLQ